MQAKMQTGGGDKKLLAHAVRKTQGYRGRVCSGLEMNHSFINSMTLESVWWGIR